MSLKLIELQVALPRTQEAGKVQEQMQQRGQSQQDYLAQGMQKESDQKQKKVHEKNKSSKFMNNKRGQSSNEYYNLRQKGKKQDSQKESHPFKGKHIDVEG